MWGLTLSRRGEMFETVLLAVTESFVVIEPFVATDCWFVCVVELARRMAASTSAEPDFEVEARLPCLAMRRREEQMMLLAVLMLNVL